MKKWQKDRNYKRVKDKDGNVVANIISVYGQDVKVSDEVFTAYSQMDRQERYAEELLMAEREISWEYTREKVYISKRWKTQNRAQRKSVSNMKM
ncbi:hypothetical protein [Agathobaculum sp.]|uniref:hypothetical protein n=1 Tax=Agathobaculum sp. TaxID=2048138 RepID=UPI003AB1242C